MSSGGTESTNPFLIGFSEPARYETVYNPFAVPEPANVAGSAPTSNPFLVGAATAGSDDVFTQPSIGTNPFAQFLIGDAAPAASAAPAFDTQVPRATNDLADSVHSDTPPPQRRKSSLGYESDSGKRSPPRRPPPPRPGPPPVPAAPLPKPPDKTKELIQSVTGALEQTSTDLLDRLQATRTPSPTPLRELASPSPTHMMEVNNLMGDDDIQVPKQSHGAGHADIQQEAMNIFDAIANLSREQESKGEFPAANNFSATSMNKTDFIPAAPAPTPASITSPTPPPAVPPPFPPHRPPPPQIPESPFVSRKSSITSANSSRRSSIEHIMREAPPLPPPPAVVEPPPIPEPPKSRDSGDGSQALFGLPANYVATRKTSHDISATRMQPLAPRKKYSLDYSSSLGEQSVIKEQLEQYSTVISPSIETPIITNDQIDNTPILETPKFPVMSTTPIMSCENINNEHLYDEQTIENEPRLIFDEATEKCPTIEPFPSSTSSCTVSTPDPFTDSAVSQTVTSDLFVTGMNAAKDEFDAFDEKFANVSQNETKKVTGSVFDPFGDSTVSESRGTQQDGKGGFESEGFGNEAPFDDFLAMSQLQQASFAYSADQSNYYNAQQWPQTQIQGNNTTQWGAFPSQPTSMTAPTSFGDPFPPGRVIQTDSTETPPTPLFDEDVSQPLEPFPRTEYHGSGWEMQIRYPIRKKFTGQRFWKKVFVRLVYQGETPHLEVLNKEDSKETLLHEWPLQPSYAISDIGAQQYDQFGKIFTVKIQFVVYKERPGVRPGQVTKAERLTNKLSQFAAYAIQGDYQGVKEFGSDLKKLGLPVEHSPQVSLICKLGSHNYEDMKQFSSCVEDALFRLTVHRDNIHINYKFEEVQITAVDELYVEQNAGGSVIKQIARVRLFFLGFLTGMPDIEIGVNDLWRQGKEVVGRHDIIPVVTEEWIRLENVEFHSCIQQDVYDETRTIKFKPPDQCYLELMRFRVRPPKNRELPLQVKTTFKICGNKVDIYSDILVPGFTSRKLGQIPCEDVVVRIPIPECWIYLFRTEKHFRYGSVKSAHRRTGKIKGLERFLGAVDTLEQHLIEVTSGHAKYEHHHRAIVWRMSRLPKEGQGAYTTHNLICHLALTSYDQVPEELAKHCYVEFTMPVTQVSHTTVRSVSICNSDSDSPPEKCVRHLARHEYVVEITQTHEETTNEYLAATMVKPKPPATAAPPKQQPLEPIPDSDSNSD